MIDIRFIEKKGKVFHFVINDKQYCFLNINLFTASFYPLKRTVKGSTLGWHIESGFVSYSQLKKSIKGVN